MDAELRNYQMQQNRIPKPQTCGIKKLNPKNEVKNEVKDIKEKVAKSSHS